MSILPRKPEPGRSALRVLIVEDSLDDAELVLRELRRGSFELAWERVETAEDFAAALAREWDVILSDFSMPRFNALGALEILEGRRNPPPLIVVSGTIGEETAVDLMKAGAADYVMKGRLERLLPVVERELREAETRRDREKAEQALRENESRYRDLVEASHALICTHDLTGRIVRANQASAESLGISKAQLEGSNLKTIVDPKFRAQFDEYLLRIKANGVDSGLMAVITATGQRRIWRYHNSLRTEGVSEPIVRGVALDVTEMFEAEKTVRESEAVLRESELRLRTIIETEPECVKTIDGDGKLLDMNAAGLAMLEADSVAEVQQHGFVNFVLREHHAPFAALHQRVMRGETGRLEFEVTGLRGTRRWLETHAAPLRDATGEVAMLLGITRDITERKRAEEVLQVSEERYRSLFENNPFPMIVFHTRTLRFEDVNAAAIEHYGYSREEFLAMTIRDLRPQEDLPLLDASLHRPRSEGRNVSVVRHRKKDGSLIDVEVTAIEIGAQDGARRLAILNDISDRKRAEEALLASEERFRQLAENIREVFWLTDPAKNEMLYISPGYETIWGRTCASLYAAPRTWMEAIHPDDRERVLQALATKQINGTYDEEYRITRPDGEVRWIHDRAFPVRDAAGQVHRLAGVALDITERKQAEEALRESEARFRGAFETSPIGMALVAPDGRWLQINSRLCEITGYSEQELLALTFQDITHPDDLEVDLFFVRQMLAGEISFYQIEKRHIHKAGHVVWIHLSVSLVRDAQGSPLYFVSQIEDITERNAAQRVVEGSERHFRTLIENASDIIAVIEEDGKIQYTSPSTERILGYKPEDLEGRRFMTLIHPDDQPIAAEKFARTLQFPDKPEEGEFRTHHKDGGWRVLQTRGTVLQPSTGPRLIVLNARDVTEQREAEDATRESENRYRSLFENNPLPMWVFDSQTLRFEDVNAAAIEHYGYSREEFLEMTLRDIRPPDDVPALDAFLPTLRNEVRNVGVWSHRKKDGSLIDVEVTAIEIGAQGRPRRLSILNDITDRKRAEEALRTSEERLRLGLNTANIAIFNQDMDLRYVWMYQPQLGFTAEQVVGHTDAELLPPEAARQVMETKRRVLESGQPERAEVAVTTGGQTFVYDLIAEPFRDASGAITGLTGASLDITERKRKEEELQASQERLRALSARLQTVREEERTGIARELHDELGQALTAIKMDLASIQRRVLSDDADSRKTAVEKIATASEIADEMIQTIRRISSELRPGMLDDLGLFPAIEWLAHDFSERTGIACRVHSEIDSFTLDRTRSTAIFRILQETLTNVARHSGATDVEIRVARTDTELKLEVHDNGKGFLPSALHDPSPLGLIGMGERASSVGGSIEFVSEPGDGVTMRLRVALSESSEP